MQVRCLGQLVAKLILLILFSGLSTRSQQPVGQNATINNRAAGKKPVAGRPPSPARPPAAARPQSSAYYIPPLEEPYMRLDPRLEADPLNLAFCAHPGDHVGRTILGVLELHQMHRLMGVPYMEAYSDGGPPEPPAPPGAPAAPAPAPINAISLLPYFQMMLGQGMVAQHPGGSSIFGGDSDRGGANSDDPKGYGCSENAIAFQLCDDTPIENLLAFPDHVLAIGQEKAFKVALDGSPIDQNGKFLEETFADIQEIPTASVVTNTSVYLFFGTKFAVYDRQLKSKTASKGLNAAQLSLLIREPVKGVLKSDNGALTLFSERHFTLYYQRQTAPASRKVEPRLISTIPGAPERIDGAFETNGVRYIYSSGWLYELANTALQIVRKLPLRPTRSVEGWLKCPEQLVCS